MFRNIAAGIVGLIVAVALVQLVQALGHSVYPVPEDLNFSDATQVAAYMASLPVGAVLFVGASWALGAFGGMLTAVAMATARPVVHAGIVGGFVAIGAVVMLILLPHPWWFTISAPLAVVVGAWLGMTIATRLRKSDAA